MSKTVLNSINTLSLLSHFLYSILNTVNENCGKTFRQNQAQTLTCPRPFSLKIGLLRHRCIAIYREVHDGKQ